MCAGRLSLFLMSQLINETRKTDHKYTVGLPSIYALQWIDHFFIVSEMFLKVLL